MDVHRVASDRPSAKATCEPNGSVDVSLVQFVFVWGLSVPKGFEMLRGNAARCREAWLCVTTWAECLLVFQWRKRATTCHRKILCQMFRDDSMT